MRKLFLKSILYIVLILISLEVIVRVFHLSKDNPSRFIDEYNVEKWEPNQKGYSVTGNRNQNFSEYRINSSGYNSYREFTPSKSKIELALVGDSYIQGFHQDYYNSIGKKIENRLGDIEVYEYGYAGYDFADQLHLINVYKENFDLIDYVVLGLRFDDDLTRDEYHVIEDRMHLESPLYKKIRNIKLLVYTQNIGVLAPIWKLAGQISSIGKNKSPKPKKVETKEEKSLKSLKYIENFKRLVKTYGYDKEQYVLLLYTKATPQIFLDYLNDNCYSYINSYEVLSKSQMPTTLVYDKHWNDYGRDVVAELIANYVSDLNK